MPGGSPESPWGSFGGLEGVPGRQDGSKMALLTQLGTNLGPSWGQLGANLGSSWGQMAKNRSQNGSKMIQKLDPKSILNTTWKLRRFLVNFCLIFDHFFKAKNVQNILILNDNQHEAKTEKVAKTLGKTLLFDDLP